MAAKNQIRERLNPNQKIPVSKNPKILVICLPGIGDALMATPMLGLLKKKIPDAQIDIVCMFPTVSYVFKNNPVVNAIYLLPFYTSKLQSLKLIWQLRKKHYDFSILAFPTYRREYHILHYLLGAKRRIAHVFHHGFYRELNFLETDLIEVDEAQHNVVNNLALLNPIGIDWKKTGYKPAYYLKLDSQNFAFGKDYIKKLGWERKKVIAFHPGSTNSPAALLRRWPTPNYSEIANYLTSKNYKILIFVGPDEAFLGEEIITKVKDKSSIHLIDHLPLNKALGILNNINLIICNDNGFGHLANGLGKKSLTLWASTNPSWSLPYNSRLVTLITAPNFTPWYRYELKRVVPQGKSSGMDKISVASVKKELVKMLK